MTPKELLKETVSATIALEVAIHMEMGVQNEQKIKQNSNTTTHSVNAINNFQGRHCNANYQPARKEFTRYPIDPKNYQYASICNNCGQRWK